MTKHPKREKYFGSIGSPSSLKWTVHFVELANSLSSEERVIVSRVGVTLSLSNIALDIISAVTGTDTGLPSESTCPIWRGILLSLKEDHLVDLSISQGLPKMDMISALFFSSVSRASDDGVQKAKPVFVRSVSDRMSFSLSSIIRSFVRTA